MRTVEASLLVASLGLLTACHDSAFEVARRDDESLRSRVDRLMVLVSVEHEGSKPTTEAADASSDEPGGSSAARPQFEAQKIVSVSLSVDGDQLGVYPVSASGSATAKQPVLRGVPDAALVIAKLGSDVDASALKTVGDWRDALAATLRSGSHVLEISGVTLKGDDGKEQRYPARGYLPFVAEDGYATAFAGHAKLVLGAKP